MTFLQFNSEQPGEIEIIYKIMKCRLINFSVGFIPFHLNFCNCKNEEIATKYMGTALKSFIEVFN